MTAPMGPEQEALRKTVLAEMVRYVAGGVDTSVVRTLLTQGVDAGEEVADMAASALPGRYVVVGERWEDSETYFSARAIYVGDTTVCVVSGDASIGDEVVEVDAVWFERVEFRAMAAAEAAA